MTEQELVNNASFYYSISLLRLLKSIEILNDDEYEKICKISAKHYNTNIICV